MWRWLVSVVLLAALAVTMPGHGWAVAGGATASMPPSYLLTVEVGGNGEGSVLGGGTYPEGTVVSLVAVPQANNFLFTGWAVDGAFAGWANPLTLTMDAPHTVRATFTQAITFFDVNWVPPASEPVTELATRGIVVGYFGFIYGTFDGVQRAQMAALIARATPAGPDTPPGTLVPPACTVAGTWDCEVWPSDFTDRNGLTGNLWRDVSVLRHYGVAQGYAAADCTARGKVFPCFGPNDPVSHAETLAFITRAMVAKGYWREQPGAQQPYAGVPAIFRTAVATYLFYTGGIPPAPADWNAGATRGWFADALWRALNAYWGTDRIMPDGRPSGGYRP